MVWVHIMTIKGWIFWDFNWYNRYTPIPDPKFAAYLILSMQGLSKWIDIQFGVDSKNV